jgi:hypothetical protein
MMWWQGWQTPEQVRMRIAAVEPTMTKIEYLNGDHVDGDLTRWIESGTATEAIAARMLKAQLPLLKEIVASGDLDYITGFVRGISDIVAAVIVSLPAFMREAVAKEVRSDLERAIEIAMKGPPAP